MLRSDIMQAVFVPGGVQTHCLLRLGICILSCAVKKLIAWYIQWSEVFLVELSFPSSVPFLSLFQFLLSNLLQELRRYFGYEFFQLFLFFIQLIEFLILLLYR